MIALPLALLARRSRYLPGRSSGVSTIIYTIPSLAMFAFIFPFTGLSSTTVLIGLVAYSPGDPRAQLPHRAAGRPGRPPGGRPGHGVRPWPRLFWQIDLPLALPAFMAGLRIATVSTVALTTVGVLVGHGGLGQLITGGFNANFYRAEIVTGAIGCVLLALVADLLLAGVERLLTPWARLVRS